MGPASLKTRMILAFILATSLLVTFFITYEPNADMNSWSGLAWDGILVGLAILCVIDVIGSMFKLYRRSRSPHPEGGGLNLNSHNTPR